MNKIHSSLTFARNFAGSALIRIHSKGWPCVVIRRARALGYPIYGAGVILDRGHPHLYVVLTLDATEEDADTIADALRDRNGIGNAFPIIRRRSAGDA